MRTAIILTATLLSACAGQRLALAPPAGIDFSGHWKLNEVDSDDLQRLIQNQMGGPGSLASGSDPARSGKPGGPHAPGSGSATPGAGNVALFDAPAAPTVGAMSEGLRWPGKELEVKHVGGVVAFTSEGQNRVYQPADGEKRAHPASASTDGGGRDRDMHPRGRSDGTPGGCGWDGKTLVIQASDPYDDRPAFEERYSVSDDGKRLIEVVGFKEGRSAGYTLSRVWDRISSSPASQ